MLMSGEKIKSNWNSNPSTDDNPYSDIFKLRAFPTTKTSQILFVTKSDYLRKINNVWVSFMIFELQRFALLISAKI